jgi:hypothetical protein
MERVTERDLAEAVRSTARRAGVTSAGRRFLFSIIEPLGGHDIATYRHSLRVGVMAARLAMKTGYADPHLALFGGAWHDIGKLDVPVDVLHAEVFGPKERFVIERHPVTGFFRLAKVNIGAALVAGMHHGFQDNPYGIDPKRWGSADVVRAARLVSACDFCDAISNRTDARHSPEERFDPRPALRRAFSGHPEWASWLAENRLGDVA